MRDLCDKTDAEIAAAFRALGYDVAGSEIVFSMDDIDAVRRMRAGFWPYPGDIDVDEPGRLSIRFCQTLPGQARKDIAVIDFGRVRAILTR